MTTVSLGFSLHELAQIEKYISEPSDVAFVSGSQQVGLGNSASDFDLYVVYRDRLERLRGGPKQFWLQNPARRIDLERHGWRAIVDAASMVNGIEAPTPAKAGRLPFDALDLYYRTAVGVAMANETGFGELTADLDLLRYDAVFAAWSLWQAGVELGRARRRLEQERPEAAYISARLALRQTVTAWMAELGHGWPNPKWAFVKLANRFGRDSDEYQRAWRLNGLGNMTAWTYFDAIAEYCEARGVPHLLPQPFEASVFVWRGEALDVAIAGRSYLVHGRRDVYETDDASRFVCAQLDGSRSVGALSELFAQRFGLAQQVASYRVAELLRTLEGIDLVESRDEYTLPSEPGHDGA